MRALGRRGGNETLRRYSAVYMQQIGHAGYVAAVAAGWGDYVRERLDEWNRRYNGAWWHIARPEWRKPAQLMDVLREGLCDWADPPCERPGTLEFGRVRVCWEHYKQARREREAAGEVYVCYACGRVTPTDELGGLVAGHELCAACSATPRLRSFWTEGGL